MARNVQVILSVDDRGTVKVKQFGKAASRAATDLETKGTRAFRNFSAAGQKTLDDMARRFTRFGAIAGGILLTLAAGAVVKFGSEFEKRMSGVRAVTQATAKDMSELEAQARELGATTVFTANQSAEAMEELGKAGFQTTEILQSMPAVLSLAAAGELEMAEAAGIAATTIRTMGLEASDFNRIADILTKTATSSKTTVSELGFALQDSAPVARQLGLNMEQLGAQLGILANRGFTATRAGTALRRIYSVFLGDLEEGEGGIAQYGIALKKNEDGTIDFADALDQLKEAGADANDIMTAFGLRGGPAFLQFTTAGSKELREFEEALYNAGGEADRVAKERLDNLRGKMTELVSALQELSLIVFDQVGPALTRMAEGSRDLARSWSELLKRSDVWGGIKTLLLAGAAAATAYALAAGVKLASSLGNAADAAVRFAIGLRGANSEMLIGISRMTTLADLSKGAKVGFAGLAAGVGVLTYSLTRAILKTTGLDAAIQDLFETALFGPLDEENAVRRLNEELDLTVRAIGKVEEKGLDMDEVLPASTIGLIKDRLSDPLRDALTALAFQAPGSKLEIQPELGPIVVPRDGKLQKLEVGVEVSEEELRGALHFLESDSPKIDAFVSEHSFDLLKEFADALELVTSQGGNISEDDFAFAKAILPQVNALKAAVVPLNKELQSLPTEDAQAFEAAWAEAGETTTGVAERTIRAFELMKKAQEDEAAAAIKAAEDKAAAEALLVESHERLAKILGSTERATTAMGETLAGTVSQALEDAGATGLDLLNVYEALGPAALEMRDKLAASGEEIGPELQAILDAAEPLLEFVKSLGEESIDPLQFVEPEQVQVLEDVGESAAQVTERLEEMDEAALALRETMEDPPDPTVWQDFYDTLGAANSAWVENAGAKLAMMANQTVSALSRAVGQAIVFGQDLGKALKNILKQAAASLIAFLVEYAIRRLVISKLIKTTTASEGAAEMSKAFGLTFANMMATMSAAPFPINLSAPGLAAAWLTIAEGGAAAGMAKGAALGAASGGAKEGGMIRRHGFFEMGELDRPEAIVPLEGPAAQTVSSKLGIPNLAGMLEDLTGRPERPLRIAQVGLPRPEVQGAYRPEIVAHGSREEPGRAEYGEAQSRRELDELRGIVRDLVALGPGIQVNANIGAEAGAGFTRETVTQIAEEMFDLIERGRIVAPGVS